jgi:hypothetical protein
MELSKNIRFSFLFLLLSYLCPVPSLSLVHPIKGSRRTSYDTTVQNQRRLHIQRENNYYSPQPRTSPLTLFQASSSSMDSNGAEKGGKKSVKKAVTKKTTKSTKVTKPLVESSSSPPPVRTKPTLVQKRKSDLVSSVAAATGMKSSECETCINAFLKTIVEVGANNCYFYHCHLHNCVFDCNFSFPCAQNIAILSSSLIELCFLISHFYFLPHISFGFIHIFVLT